MGGLSPSKRIAAFQQRVSPIEAMFAAGKISAAQRRDMLIQARDAADITTMRTIPVNAGATEAAQLTPDAYNSRRREECRRRRARKRAAERIEAGKPASKMESAPCT